MRIWHPDLYPYLCRQHLLACWREGLGCLAIILHNKPGYRGHPQVKAYRESVWKLHEHLLKLRFVMLSRGYRPRAVFSSVIEHKACLWHREIEGGGYNEWQTLEEQIEVLKGKDCECYNNITRKETHGKTI